LPTRVTINDSAAIVAAAREDMGIGLVADYAARPGLRDGTLEQVLAEWSIDDPRAPLMVHAIYSPTRHLPRKVRAFIDFLLDQSAGSGLPAAQLIVPACISVDRESVMCGEGGCSMPALRRKS
jgi:DNA-binding transcriptional LysR family regulator